MKEKINRIIFLVLCISIILIHYGTFNNNELKQLKTIKQNISTDSDIYELINLCETNVNITARLQCLINYVDTIFIYKERPDDVDISFNVLFDEGGDCRDWSIFWEYVGIKYGYNTKSVIINIDKHTLHMFMILSNNKSYCIVDQNVLNCIEYA